jgi:hypothetical protein
MTVNLDGSTVKGGGHRSGQHRADLTECVAGLSGGRRSPDALTWLDPALYPRGA